MNKPKVIHAIGLTEETDCGIQINADMSVLDTRLIGNINKVTCKRCLKVAFKN